MKNKWKPVKKTKTWSFCLEDEPEAIHIVQSGSENLYIVVHDDAFQMHTGKTELLSKKEIENKYKIKLK